MTRPEATRLSEIFKLAEVQFDSETGEWFVEASVSGIEANLSWIFDQLEKAEVAGDRARVSFYPASDGRQVRII